MRLAGILSLAMGLFLFAAVSRAATPFSWLGFGQGHSVKTTNVSQSSHRPTVVAKMVSGTKRLVNNTKNLITPKPTPVKRHGATVTHRVKRPEPPKQSFFQKWFSSESPSPPKTVGE